MLVKQMAAAVLLLILSTLPAPARELEADEKLMFAAATVLAGASGISNGQVIVADADHARFRIGLPDQPEGAGERVTFRRVQDCVYEEKIATGGTEDDQYVMIDFGRLTGRWTESGSELDLISKGDAHCFHNPGRTACWPAHVHLPYSNISHQRMIHDATFLIKNGCGMSAIGDPY